MKNPKLSWSASLVGLTLLAACGNEPLGEPAPITAPIAEQAPSHKISHYAPVDYATLKAELQNPPHSSKPLTWLHAMSGNMSAAGITKDLEAISDAGIGGTLLFNVTQGVPLGNVKFNSTEHIDLIGHLAKESQRLGLSFGMHNCDGWTSSGGPWITPEHSMKHLTFNETVVQGGEINLQLAQPFSRFDYYQDVAVIAYPSLATELIDASIKPVVTASDPNFDLKIARNSNLEDYSALTATQNKQAWLQFSYSQPYTLRLVDMLIHEGRGLEFSLHTSNDGQNFTEQQALTLRRPGKTTYALDEAFDGITAKHFRLVTNKTVHVKEVNLSSTPTMHNYLGRTSASRSDFQELGEIGRVDKALIINPAQIRNLTDQLKPDGTLNTQLPAGNWTIMRFGFTSTGAVNIPASREGTGLEVDKFSKASFKTHYDAYVTNVINKVKEVAPNALHTLEIDSYEVGAQNWTQGYEQHFKERFGYDLVPFLPLFAGKFVDSADISEKVLWDTRDLNNQLITENYYGYFTELANQDGIQTYLEPYGSGPFNELDVASKADLPMGEFWLKRENFRISASSSTANIYNKPIVAAEAFTQFPENNWLFHPAIGKADGDKSWALGVNQHVFHRFAHQANTHVMPGMTMNRWGAHLDRTQPWWDSAGKAWFKYIARGQHLLRQGHEVADVLWYLGDATPTVCPEQDALASVMPTHINYDCLNTEVLQQLTVNNGLITLPHGSEYKILVLDNHHILNFSTVEKLYQLAKQGAVIIGDPIQKLAGRNVTPQQQSQFDAMVKEIWSRPTTYDIAIDLKTSHGHSGEKHWLNQTPNQQVDWAQIFAKHDWNFDLVLKDARPFYFTHRKTPQQDIYFVYNDSPERKLFDATFNVAGKIPELWDAQTGAVKKLGAFASYTSEGKTHVPFRLDAGESVFVVFSQSATSVEPAPPSLVINQDIEVLLNEKNQLQTLTAPVKSLAIDGSWSVSFEGFYGLEQTFDFEQLIDWNQHPEQSIRDYSGIATYRKTIVLPESYLVDNVQLNLDLGQVDVAALVTLNGNLVGTAWKAPYTLDISQYAKAGENKLEIKVANLWVNRLLADRKLPDTSGFEIARWQDPVVKMPKWYTDNKPQPETQRLTFSTQRFMQDDEPRVSSGLIGPVQITIKEGRYFE
ncbi:glycoside hydrolase [Paraglaciecola aquimarina]|uniref:Glycoside hydrolase n=1 Tax=Paraglaciecola algarum TaxID=3050085 RepID=A0ABS9D7I1_9ALTE|nr:glycosyl hydrolase [Paraglaciecola sp. G1-23]MCF2948875.1 glycoside hydrolase [Paraglaciecola sp. G1-23]